MLRQADEPAQAGFADLFGLDAIDELVSVRGLRTPFLRLVKDGAAIPERSYIGGGGIGAAIGDQAHDDGVYEQMAAGATLVLQGLHRMWPPLLTFGQDLAADLGHPTQINAYVTPAQSQGFGAHHDVHDVFVLQLSGEKRWLIHEPVQPLPLASQPTDHYAAAIRERAEQDPVIDTVLRPGDCLYLPRGYLHSATALGGVSAHLTIGVPVWTRYSLLERVLDDLQRVAADDPAMRESMPLGVDVGDPAVVGAELDVVREAVERALAEVSATSLAARLDTSVRGSQRPAPIRPLAQLAATASGASRVRLRPHLRASTARRDDGAVRLTGRFPTVVLPPSELADLEAVLTGDAVDVPADAASPRARLVTRLLRAGVVEPI